MSFKLNKRKPELPDFRLPQGFSTSVEYLHHLVLQGLEKHYPGKEDIVIKQAEHELDIINLLGYTSYFLIIADIVNWAKRQDIPISPGHGSATASLITYALGISSIDPLMYGLVFERFANLEHPTKPNIRIDLSMEHREQVINYVIEKYGNNRVGRISSYGTDKDGKKHIGLHAAGLVISRNDLNEYGPVYHDPNTGFLVTQYDIFELENHGLIRFDFLGEKILDDISHSEKTIRKQGKQFADFSVNLIPVDDKTTFKLFSEGRTNKVFQFESTEIQEILQQVKPDCFEHLITINTLYRPGSMSNIPEFIERRHGRKPIEYPHPCLEDILKETYGLIIYQEQLMRIIQKIAGYTLGQADVLRRYLLKAGKTIQDTDEEKKRFIANAIAQGFNEGEAKSIFDQLVSVAGFVYPKSHAVGYTMLAYQTAYLKANF